MTIKEKVKKSDQSKEMENENFLIVHNDNHNTFEHVIQCLIIICSHSPEQAEQCTYNIHFKGKCDVKKGDLKTLKVMAHKLELNGLTVSIE